MAHVQTVEDMFMISDDSEDEDEEDDDFAAVLPRLDITRNDQPQTDHLPQPVQTSVVSVGDDTGLCGETSVAVEVDDDDCDDDSSYQDNDSMAMISATMTIMILNPLLKDC
jgi:hypothetical protein